MVEEELHWMAERMAAVCSVGSSEGACKMSLQDGGPVEVEVDVAGVAEDTVVEG